MFKKTFNWIKNKVGLLFNNGLISKINTQSKLVKDITSLTSLNKVIPSIISKYLNEQDKQLSLESIIDDINKISENKNNLSEQDKYRKLSELYNRFTIYHSKFIFDKNGKIFDINQIIDVVLTFINDTLNGDINPNMGMNRSTLNGSAVTRELWSRIIGDFETGVDYNKITVDEMYKHLEDLPNMYKYTLRFYNDSKKFLLKELDKIETEMDAYLGRVGTVNMTIDEVIKYEQLTMANARFRMLLRTVLLPYNVVMGYVRLLTHVNKEILSSENDYITTSIKPYDKLFHVSAVKLNTNVLSPRQPKTAARQWLPNRVCFSPTVLQSVIATPINLENEDGYIRDNCYKYLHLYEGVPDKGKTRYVRDEIVKHSVGEATITDEIDVTTDIKIKYLGIIKVEYIPYLKTYTGLFGTNIDVFDKRRILNIQFS